jgi:16S rRNA (adenine1518-N6/adenine1519-N6)-dimethyltransferase
LTNEALRPPFEWRELLRRHAIRPDKRLGQHFLFAPATLEKIASAAEILPGEPVLEIGAGVGSLTCALAAEAGQVIAVEFDRRLEPALSEATQSLPNVRLVMGDVLALDLDGLIGQESHAVVGNIPYNITSAVIRKVMELDRPARVVVLTIQEEVAKRITSGPGDMSLLALSVQLYGQPKVVLRLGRGQFWPQPDVDSAVIRIDTASDERRSPEQLNRIFTLARAGFGQRRKQLKNALAHGLGEPTARVSDWLEGAGIDPRRRAQSLTLEELDRLSAVASTQLPGD